MRLTEEQRQELCARYTNGESSTALSRAYGVTRTSICSLLDRRGISRRPVGNKTGYTCNHDAFAHPSPARDYWCGFVLVDGCIVGTTRSLTLNLSAVDEAHLHAFRDFLGSNHAVSRHKRKEGGNDVVFHTLRSAKIAADLAVLGMCGPKLTRVPSAKVAGSVHFWRGVMDGDGSIWADERNGVQFSLCGSKALLDIFLSFLHLRGIALRLSVRPHRSIYRVGTSGPEAVATLRLLYAAEGPALLRKAQLATALLHLYG